MLTHTHSMTPMTPAMATNSPPALNANSPALFALEELELALAVESAVDVPVDVPVVVVAAEPLVVVDATVEAAVFVEEY